MQIYRNILDRIGCMQLFSNVILFRKQGKVSVLCFSESFVFICRCCKATWIFVRDLTLALRLCTHSVCGQRSNDETVF